MCSILTRVTHAKFHAKKEGCRATGITKHTHDPNLILAVADLRTGCFDKGSWLSLSGTHFEATAPGDDDDVDDVVLRFSAMHGRQSAVYKHMIHGEL